MDLNGDGHADVLSGSYSRQERPMAGLFQVLWGSPDGFKAPEPLKGSDGKLLIIPADDNNMGIRQKICTRPTAVDWDADGDLDLVVGNFDGTFFVFRGEGKGRFAPEPAALKCEGEDLRITGVHSDPFVIDWDGDGDLDLLSGSSNGGVQWAENLAAKGSKEPKLQGFKELIPGTEYGKSTGDTPSDSTRIWAEDVNGDGKPDLLVGDRVITKAGGTERTGHVWLYVQK